MVNCECIVHKTFAGVLQSNVTCLRCGNVTTTFDPMLDISLGLRPAEKKKKTTTSSISGQSPTARRSKQANTLVDCLDR